MYECSYCGTELKFILKNEGSEYYRCNNCNTVWDIIFDPISNTEETIDIERYLFKVNTSKKMAS